MGDIVQEIFTNLWDRMDWLEIQHSYQTFLFASVRNLVISRILDGEGTIRFRKVGFEGEKLVQSLDAMIEYLKERER